MKIHAFQVEQKGPRTLEAILNSLHRLPLEDRFFGDDEIRLEDRARRGGFILMDFAKARTGHGPGRMARNRPLRGINLGQGENFGEDTAVAFDPRTGYAAIQYNQVGPRIGRIENYLFAYDLSLGGLGDDGDEDHCGFQFGAVLKPDAYNRLRRFGIIHEIDFAVSLPGARESDAAVGRSLSSVLEAPMPPGIETLSVRMTAVPRSDGGLGDGAMGIIQGIRRLGHNVTQARVRGKRGADDTLEKVDLISDRLTTEAAIRLGNTGRYSQADRWQAVGSALANWQRQGALR